MPILQHVNGTKLGTLVLESRGFYPGAHWYWIGVGANAGFMFAFNFFYLMCLTYLDRKMFSTTKNFSIFATVMQRLKLAKKILQHSTRKKPYYQKKMKMLKWLVVLSSHLLSSHLRLRLLKVHREVPHPQKSKPLKATRTRRGE